VPTSTANIFIACSLHIQDLVSNIVTWLKPGYNFGSPFIRRKLFMLLFRKPVFLAITVGHFTLDIFNSAGPILVTFMNKPMGLTAFQIGLAIGTYQFMSALMLPLFGWLADNLGSRWLGPGSVAWTIGFLTLSMAVAQQTNNFVFFMIPFVIASLGSSAFHPLGTKHASDESVHRAATGTAIFFLFGQAGLAGGPPVTGLILGSVGISGMYVLTLVAGPVIMFMFYAMRHTYPELAVAKSGFGETAAVDHQDIDQETIRWGAIALLALLVGLRSWTTIGTVSFLPKMFQDMGWSPAGYGAVTGSYWLASGIMGVFAGNRADRWGRRQVTFVTLLTGSIALYFLPLNDGWLAFPLVFLSGGLLGASHSILVVIIQSLLPGRKAFASGVILGYLFGVGAVATWGIGWLADIWGLTLVIQTGSALTVVAALLALALPTTREVARPQPEGVPV
jgi:FSR family fosmidomycin resistance protein-like MFS transporter